MTRILSDLRYRRGGKYRFTLTADLVVDLGKGYEGYHLLENAGTVWAILNGDTLTVFAGYAFDGCSPAWRIFGIWIGTPTLHSAVAASCAHDVLRGFLHLPCVPFNRDASDDIFFDILRSQDHRWRDIYHGAVSGRIGRLYSLISRTPSQPKASCRSCRNYSAPPP